MGTVIPILQHHRYPTTCPAEMSGFASDAGYYIGDANVDLEEVQSKDTIPFKYVYSFFLKNSTMSSCPCYGSERV